MSIKNSKIRIVCFGDSNTWGYDTSTDGRFADDIRWTGVLSNRLGEEYTVIEEGLCGRTTAFQDSLGEGLCGLDYIAPCLMSHSPLDWLVIQLGTNDCKQRFSLTAVNIAGGLKRLITKAKQTPAWKTMPNILVVTPAPIGIECEQGMFAGEMGICSAKSHELATVFQQVAEQMECSFLDAGTFTEMNKLDYMHYSVEGHKRLGDKIAEFFQNERKGKETLRTDL